MKRLIALFLSLALILSLTACGSSGSTQDREMTTATESAELDDGVSFRTTALGQASYSLSEIPYYMQFSDKEVPLEKVVFFEEYEDHGYTPFIMIALSRENLSDDDLYWMTKYDTDRGGKEITVNVRVDSDENDLDSASLNQIGIIYNDEYIYYFFFGDHSRYSYKGSSFSCQIIHIPTGLTEKDTVYYYYDMQIDSSNYADTEETLTENEQSALNQAIDNYLNN